MAYAAVMSLINTMERILQAERFQILDWDDQIRSIHEKATIFQSFLEDFYQSTDEEVQSLATQIGDAAYKVYIVIGSHTSIILLSDSVFLRDHVELQKVTEEIDHIIDEIIKCRHSSNELTEKALLHAGYSRAIPTCKNTVVGLDKDLIAIKDRMTGHQTKLQVISIIGMGGIVKTTLAKKIYDDPLIVHHFHVHDWVTISRTYDPSEVANALLNELQCKGNLEDVYKTLKKRRYLIVMDDVWDKKVWDEVRRIFSDDYNGSRIILTTRPLDVAAYPYSSTLLHQMHFLGEDESWNLLRQEVFAQEILPFELGEVGMVIAKRCCGLPPAISMIGGLISKADRRIEYWDYVAECDDPYVYLMICVLNPHTW